MSIKILHFLLVKIPNKCLEIFYEIFSKIYIKTLVASNQIQIGRNSRIRGFPRLIISLTGKVLIGEGFKLNSGYHYNPIGRNQRSIFFVRDGAILKIGNNVGMSSVAIVCEQEVVIGNNVRIGGNVVIYDTDFHSLDLVERTAVPEIRNNVKMSKIDIGDNVFIGAHSIILKGVSIGDNSIIGSGSVVSKSIPQSEIWAGNPIKFIRKL